jgi:HD-like signal output (HDOD) protein
MSVEQLSADVGPSPVDQLAQRIDEVSSLPHIAAQVIEVVSNDRAGAVDLKTVLEADPALSARVLRCVNSSAYALRQPVPNLQLAVAYLGFKEVRNLAVTASVAEIFRREVRIGSYTRQGLWKHLVATGVCARMIGLRRRLPEFEDCFLAGLLHDLGIVLEDQHRHEPFAEMLAAADGPPTLLEREQQVLGFDHTQLGERVARQWRLPPAVQASIRYHHDCEAYQGEHLNIVRAVEVANMLATIKGISSVGQNLLRPNRAAVDGLQLNRHDLDVLLADLDKEMARYQHLLSA